MLSKFRSYVLTLVALFAGLCSASAYESILIQGANGKAIEFAGVKEARKDGIVLLVKEGDDPILVAWESLDLEALEAHEVIFQAYTTTKVTHKTVPLRLGFYENMLSKGDFLTGIAKALKETHEFPVPKLSDFFEHKDNDQNFLSTSYAEDKNAAKRSKRFVDDYEELLVEFFKAKDVQLNLQTITWTYSNNDPFVIVKEATLPGAQSRKLSTLDLLLFFANEKNHSRPRCCKYFSIYPKSLDPVIRSLGEQIKTVDNRLLAEDSDISRYRALLSSTRDHFVSIRDKSAMDASVGRDFSALIRELQLGPQ